MDNFTVTKGGQATCYLSRVQMAALYEEAAAVGLAHGQLVKQAVVELLIARGRLPEFHSTLVTTKQEELKREPHPSKKRLEDLRRVAPRQQLNTSMFDRSHVEKVIAEQPTMTEAEKRAERRKARRLKRGQ